MGGAVPKRKKTYTKHRPTKNKTRTAHPKQKRPRSWHKSEANTPSTHVGGSIPGSVGETDKCAIVSFGSLSDLMNRDLPNFVSKKGQDDVKPGVMAEDLRHQISTYYCFQLNKPPRREWNGKEGAIMKCLQALDLDYKRFRNMVYRVFELTLESLLLGGKNNHIFLELERALKGK